MDLTSAQIRPLLPADLDDLYSICVQTADNGADATALFSDPRLPGHVFAAPYAVFEPSLTFVAQDANGVAGYIVGALDSQAFRQRLERDWWPPLRDRYPEPQPDVAETMSLAERHMRHDIHHRFGADDQLTERFPSHLHINLLPRLQGRGLGRQLIEALISELRSQGSPGVHLRAGRRNQRAVEFYRHVGFTELPAIEVHIFAMDLGERPPAR